MLQMPADASSIASIIGIDPGSNTLGVAHLQFDLDTLAIVSTEAMTLQGAKVARHSWATEIHGERLGRIESHKDYLIQLFKYIQPLEIASEAPFFSHLHPSAYGSLVEVISAIRQAVMQYDLWTPLHLIDPPTVKKAVGVNGKSGGKEGKEKMRQAILAMPQLCYRGDVALTALDEHSIDAIAVAYCRFNVLLHRLCLKK